MTIEVGAPATAVQMPEPPDRALIALVDRTEQEVPLLFERDDKAAHTIYGEGAEKRWFPGDAEAPVEYVHTWAGVLARAAESGFEPVRLFRESEPEVAGLRVALDRAVAAAKRLELVVMQRRGSGVDGAVRTADLAELFDALGIVSDGDR